MIQYNDISDLLSEGKTPAQIAALLAVRNGVGE
jgi:DNA-binding CsgD family transcriptional regulator